MDEKILRNAIQKTIHEIGVIILYIVLSATISYFFYISFPVNIQIKLDLIILV